MAKSYLLVYDVNNNVMIGQGGIVNGHNRTGWHLPGGTVGPQESGLDAVKREFVEETGYPFALLPKLGDPLVFVSYPDPDDLTFYTLRLTQTWQAVDANHGATADQARNVQRLVNPNDEPFANVIWISSAQFQAHGAQELAVAHGTDWFYDPLRTHFFGEEFDTSDLD